MRKRKNGSYRIYVFKWFYESHTDFVIPAKAGIQGNGSLALKKQPAVYLLTRQRNGTRSIGVTSDLVPRVWEHRNDRAGGFSKRYHIHCPAWYELHTTMEAALQREKPMKEWKRMWKLAGLERINPCWQDLYDTIV